jgi:hypothetical protein
MSWEELIDRSGYISAGILPGNRASLKRNISRSGLVNRGSIFYPRFLPFLRHHFEKALNSPQIRRASEALSAHYAIEHGLSALRAALELEVRVCCRHDWRAGEQGSEKDGALQSEQVHGLSSSCGRGRWMRNPTGLPLWHSTEFGAQRTGRGWVDPHGPVSQP